MPPPVKKTPEQLQQAADIAARTRGAEAAGWSQAVKRSAKEAPYENLMSGPDWRDPGYAVKGLVGNVQERMRQQGETASQRFQPGVSYAGTGLTPAGFRGTLKRGGPVHATGLYRLHKGEHVIPKTLAQRYRERKHG